MSTAQRLWNSISVLTLRSRSSWTRWRLSLTQARLQRKLAREQRRHRLLQTLLSEQLLRVESLQQELGLPTLEQELFRAPTYSMPELEQAMDQHLRATQGAAVTRLLQEPETELPPPPPAKLQIAEELGLLTPQS